MGISKVVISFNQDENEAEFSTSDPSWIFLMDRLVREYPAHFRKEKETAELDGMTAKVYALPKSYITINTPVQAAGEADECHCRKN